MASCFPISGFLMIQCNAKSESSSSGLVRLLLLPPRCQYPGWDSLGSRSYCTLTLTRSSTPPSTFFKSRQVRNRVLLALGIANRPPKLGAKQTQRKHENASSAILLLFSFSIPPTRTAARHKTAPQRCVPHNTLPRNGACHTTHGSASTRSSTFIYVGSQYPGL